MPQPKAQPILPATLWRAELPLILSFGPLLENGGGWPADGGEDDELPPTGPGLFLVLGLERPTSKPQEPQVAGPP